MTTHNSLAQPDDEVDWDLSDACQAAIEKAARRVSSEFSHVEYQDLRQELMIWLALRPKARAEWEAGHKDTLWRRVHAEALHYAEREAISMGMDYNNPDVAHRAWSLDVDWNEESAPGMTAYVQPYTAGKYTREAVEHGLYSLWDDDCGFGETNPLAPPPDMPRGPGGDPSHGGGSLAIRADLSRAWDKAPLTAKERQRIYMTNALLWRPKEIYEFEGTSRQGVNKSIESGLSKITRFLNGEPDETEDEDE